MSLLQPVWTKRWRGAAKPAPFGKYILILPKSPQLPVYGAGVAVVHVEQPPHFRVRVLPRGEKVVAKAWHPTRARLMPIDIRPHDGSSPDRIGALGGDVRARISLDFFAGALGSGGTLEISVRLGKATLAVVGTRTPAFAPDDVSARPIVKRIAEMRERTPGAPRHQPPPDAMLLDEPRPALSIRWRGRAPDDLHARYPRAGDPMLVLPRHAELLPVAGSGLVMTFHSQSVNGFRAEILPSGLSLPAMMWNGSRKVLEEVDLTPFQDAPAESRGGAFEKYARLARIGGHPRWLQGNGALPGYRYVAHLPMASIGIDTGNPFDVYILLHQSNRRARVIVQVC